MSLTLQSFNQAKRHSRRVKPGRLPADSLTAITTLLILFLVFVFVLFPICSNLFSKLGSRARILAKQLSQLQRVETALDLFKSELNFYPPSGALDENGIPYCGAMKLVEAIMGQDLYGFHPDSVFRRDGTDSKGMMLYPDTNNLSRQAYSDNFNMRKRYYLRDGNCYHLKDLYDDIGPFDGNEYVLCDTYRVANKISNDEYIGMPVLYYKANTSKTAHDINDPNNPENIYNYRDNHALLALGVPGKPELKHPLYENPKIFYEITKNPKVSGPIRPYGVDTYILLSAGKDGLYGTKDDIANFDF